MNKRFLICFLLAMLGLATNAQIQSYKKIVSIRSAEFNRHLPVVTLISKPFKSLKIRGIIRIKTSKKAFVFKDDGEMQQYKYEGELSNGQLVLIHELEPNTEEYYLINKQSGKIDTLFDKPIFFSNNNDFICLEGEGTDVNQRIQIGSITNGGLVKKRLINLPADLLPDRIYWSADKAIVIENNRSKFYKLIL
jgi:hypothetical protein